MISGVRLTQLSHGEPLLGSSFSYDGLYGVQAVEKRLENLFNVINYFGFNFVIDTINPQEDIDGNIHLNNNGLYGHIWSFEERMTIYRKYQSLFGFKLVMEINFPSNLNELNWKKYSEFIKNLMLKYNDILYWQIGDEPEKIINRQYKCNPVSYVKLIKSIYNVKLINNNLQIGAPGIFQGLIDFNNDVNNNWLSQAIGDVYKFGDPEFEVIGENGFLSYIDFFSIHGRQEISELRYDKFPYIIEKLKAKINSKIQKNINIFSIDQGHVAKANNTNALDIQGYQEIKEILNAYKCGVFSFKTQLIDEYNDKYAWGGYFDEKLEGRGLLYYQIGDNMYKPASNTYQFILNTLKEYSYVGNTNKVSELNPNIESITLYNGDPNSINASYAPTKSATIIWSNTFKTNRVVLTPHYAREYMVKIGEPISLTQSVDIDFSKYDFVVVYETLEKNIIDIDNINSLLDKKLSYAEKTMVDLIQSLPNSYNKEITDTNYYKLLRSLALEISDAKVELHKVKHNQYLDDVENDYLYKNFGVLVGLSKKSHWDNDKYRRLIKGVTKSLLEGPTYQSIVEAIKLFTNFNVELKELYKDPNANETIGTDRTQFLFAIQIEKPLDINSSQKEIERDVDYVIDIVKPAHTLRLLIISLAGDENYKDQYEDNHGIEFKNSDKLSNFDYNQSINEGTFGWKSKDYDGQFKTAGSSNIEFDPLINGGLFLGPRYALFDDMLAEGKLNNSETVIKDWLETMDSLLSWTPYEDYQEVDEKLNIEFDIKFNEHKFGLYVDNLIELSGREIINGVLVKSKVLNKYRLGFTSKLKDENYINFDTEYSEKYIFSNLLNPFKFRTRIENIDSGVLGFPATINGKFDTSQEIVTSIDMGMEECRYLTNDNRVLIDKDLIIENIYLETYNRLIHDENYLSFDLYDKFKEISDSLISEYVLFEKYNFTEDRDFSSTERYYEDALRAQILVNLDSSKHMKYVKNIDVKESDSKKIYLPDNRIISINDEYFKVFVNGKLIPQWYYSILTVPNLPECINGIKFNDNCKLETSDIITIMYFCDKQLYKSDFPIKDENSCELLFNSNSENWNVTENVKDKAKFGFLMKEKIKDIVEIFDTFENKVFYNEKFTPKRDLYEISDILDSEDISDWLNKFYEDTNKELMEVEYINLEFNETPIEEFDMDNFIVNNSEIVKKPVDVIVFYLDGEENNILYDMNIIDVNEISYCCYEQYDKISDICLMNEINMYNLLETYYAKDDNSNHYVNINNNDIIKTNEILNSYDLLTAFEEIISSIEDNNYCELKISYIDYYDKDIKDTYDDYCNIDNKDILILQDNLDKTYTFNNIKFAGIIGDNEKNKVYKFPYKPLLDINHNEICNAEKIKSTNINCKFNIINNNFHHEKYSFKEDTFEFN